MPSMFCYLCMFSPTTARDEVKEYSFKTKEVLAWHIVNYHGISKEIDDKFKELEKRYKELQKIIKQRNPMYLKQQEMKRKLKEREDMDTLMYYLNKQIKETG